MIVVVLRRSPEMPLTETRLPLRPAIGETDAPAASLKFLSDKAYRAIEERIVTLDLAPGSIVTEGALAAELMIGRTPVREALQRLAREGLVQFLPNRGLRITEIDARTQLNLIEVRRRLEGLTAALAAERADPAQRERFRALDRSLREVASHADEIVFLRLDRAFNQLLREAARNPFCSMMMTTIEGLARRFYHRHRAAVDLARTAELHADIARAVADEGPAAAEAAVCALIDYNERLTLRSRAQL
jgi:DNA-binding GntR family transcriptional regulator